jgi:cupin 2 domain-containing protein
MSTNLLDTQALHPAADEIVEVLAHVSGVRVERIVSAGQSSPKGFWYDQDHDEWVAVVQGEGIVGFEGGREVRLGVGDTLFIPAHQRHRVVSTSAAPYCIWLAIHGVAAL